MIYQTYDIIVEGYKISHEREVVEMAGEIAITCGFEVTENDITHARHIDTADGVDVYHDYGADYYFFCPAS